MYINVPKGRNRANDHLASWSLSKRYTLAKQQCYKFECEQPYVSREYSWAAKYTSFKPRGFEKALIIHCWLNAYAIHAHIHTRAAR